MTTVAAPAAFDLTLSEEQQLAQKTARNFPIYFGERIRAKEVSFPQNAGRIMHE